MSDLTITKVTSSRTPWQNNTSLTLHLTKCPENIFSSCDTGVHEELTQPAVPHIRKRKHTHFSRGVDYFNDTRSASLQKSTAYLEDNPSASPLCKSNVRRHHIRLGGCRRWGDLHRNNHSFNHRNHLTRMTCCSVQWQRHDDQNRKHTEQLRYVFFCFTGE